MSTPSSVEDATVLSPNARAVDQVILSNNSSADCPDSGFIVLLLTNAASHPEPTVEWSTAGGGWHGVYLSWNPGIVDGNASCASPCWTGGMVSLDVPPHTTYTIDLGVTFNPAANGGAFAGDVYYTAQAGIPDGTYGAELGWAYVNQSGSGAGGSGAGGGGGSSGHGSSPAASAHASNPSQQTTAANPSGPATLSPSASASTATPAQSASPSATPVATASVAPVADVHSGGSGGVSAVITVIAAVILALAGGTGFILARRRRGQAS